MFANALEWLFEERPVDNNDILVLFTFEYSLFFPPVLSGAITLSPGSSALGATTVSVDWCFQKEWTTNELNIRPIL